MHSRKLAWTALATALTFGAGLVAPPVARADDTEVFFTSVSDSDKPNIMFIVDSGETMGTLVGETVKWQSAKDWAEVADEEYDVSVSCDPKKLYWTAGSLPIITDSNGNKTVNCSTMPYIDFDLANFDDPTKNKFVCKTALDLLRATSSVGYVTQGLIAQYDATSSTVSQRSWKKMQGLANNGSINLANIRPAWITECLADDNVHGINEASTAGSRPNNATTQGFGTNSSTANNSVYTKAKGAFEGSFTFYTANRIAFEVVKANVPASTSNQTRLQAVQAALDTIINSVSGVRVGLMRFDNNAGASKGGMVAQEMTDIETGKAEILDTLFTREACNKNDASDCQLIFVPADKKSIGETLWEAYRYYSGGSVDFGKATNLKPTIPFPSVPDSMVNPNASQPVYESPVSACGKNYIILLTDGLTEQDNSRDVTGVSALTNFKFTPEVKDYGTSNAKCDVEDIKAGPTSSDCVDDLPAWMFRNDVNTAVAGIQNVKTYTVGFDLGSEQLGLAARSVLRDAARRGGGSYYDATNQSELELALNDAVREILIDNASFTAPSVAVNAFNRTQNLNDLYMSVFKPSLGYRWFGNVKKYKLTPEGEIIDANNKPAVDVSTGFFATGTQSFWSTSADGPDASLGGAASKLTLPDATTNPRKIYTNLAANVSGTLSVVDSGALQTQLSALKDGSSANTDLANLLLYNVTAPTLPPSGSVDRSQLIDWAYGIDVLDRVGTSGTTDDARLDMGDPLHARPATVIYDGPAEDPDTTLYATTNDGMLHAIDARTGAELWAFIPTELLPRLQDLHNDDGVTERVYGLDGSVKAHRIDRNQDGTIDANAGDRVYLYFGMRRGGRHVYALNVTNRASPELLWRAGDADVAGFGSITTSSSTYLPGIGQTWSSPTIARVGVKTGSVVEAKLVAIFGGGYDPSHDVKTTYVADTVGNRLYMVDALTGALIWHAGPTGAVLNLSEMTSSIVAEPRSFDLTGDGYDDRMYVSDLGGRIWRFDIVNGNTASTLVEGGVFASMGGAATPATASENRKFFYAPDPSLVRYGGGSWINIAIGSGDRERPVSDTAVQNQFYSLRDYNIFGTIPSNNYVSDCSTTSPCHKIIETGNTGLTDVTTTLNPTLASSSAGWFMDLAPTGWEGEKALAESRTFNNAVYFTTYTPRLRDNGPECGVSVGTSQLYVVSAITANPVFNYDTSVDGATSIDDRSKELAQGAIAPEVVFVFPTPNQSTSPPANCAEISGCDPDDPSTWPPPPAVPPTCLVGLETCGAGIANPPVRTYWRQRDAN